MKKILLTGASGFIGRELLTHFSSLDYKIGTISRRDNSFGKGAKNYCCDLEITQDLIEVFNDFKPDVVIHHAAQSRIHDPLLDFTLNVSPSLNLIDLSSKFLVEKFIFSSSGGAVYGEVPFPHKANVCDLPSLNSPYGVGKLTLENYLALYGKINGLKFNILRYSNVIGRFNPKENLNFVIPKLILRASERLPLEILSREILGDSGLLRDYISVNDIVKINLMCVENIIKENVINVCSGRDISVLQIASLINDFFGNHSSIQFLEPREGVIKRSVLDPVPLEQYLTPIDFELALEDTLKNTE
jgi:UDP-glucose 4-epimerase